MLAAHQAADGMTIAATHLPLPIGVATELALAEA
jgi:ABC-type transport system involved in cytochrome c biogenesis ATPase subunit